MYSIQINVTEEHKSSMVFANASSKRCHYGGEPIRIKYIENVAWMDQSDFWICTFLSIHHL